MTRRPPPQRAWRAVTLAVIAAVGAGCGHAGPKADGGTTIPARPYVVETLPPASATTTTTVDPAKAAILAAYRSGEAAYLAVVTHYPVVPTDPRLPQYMTGTELISVRNQLTTAGLVGQYAAGTIDLAPVLRDISGATATIDDCIFDHTSGIDARTHKVVTPAASQRSIVTVTMQMVDGTWKIADYRKVGTGCVPAG